MEFYIDHSVLIESVYSELNTDSILQGSSYLNGTSNIWIGRAPYNVDLPFLLVTAGQSLPNEMQTYTQEIRVYVYVSLLSDGQPNNDLGNRLLSRIEQLLSNVILTISGYSVKPFINNGISQCQVYEEELDTRARGHISFIIHYGKTS